MSTGGEDIGNQREVVGQLLDLNDLNWVFLKLLNAIKLTFGGSGMAGICRQVKVANKRLREG
ncbi:hypothetical protein AKG95_00455 [Janthinobacterium lividum]|uniref:Uncharacterized protein n=1 Tax=Janthinobacterium lividum TaxID=29581 RepID=A0A1S1UGJ7_9BURK|nr:hypothetical protein AKG95_00455 [Janthinobacterium lividum]